MENQNSLKILVVGGHGFVGLNLVTALKNTPHQITALSRIDGLDLTNYETTQKYLTELKPDVIFNCAAHVGSLHYVSKYAADVLNDNIQMSLNLYRGVANTCPQALVVNLLSNCSYPGTSDVQIESQWWNGEVHDSVFSYGNAKKSLYVISKCYNKQYNTKSINFLVPNTFGPGDSVDPNKTHALNGMIIRMISAQEKNEPEFEIWGSGKPIREWAYIDDVVKILLSGIDLKEDLIYPVNIAQNKGYSIKDSAEFIAEALEYKGKLVFNTKYQDGAPTKILDNTKFKILFPNFSFFDHKKGIAETVKYYKNIPKNN